MSSLLLIQLALYEILELAPCIVLSAVPFRSQIRSRKLFALAALILYSMGILRQLFLLYLPPAAAPLSCLWILLYLAAYKIAVRASFSKVLFVLINVLNCASLTAILYSHIGNRWFEVQLADYPYCFAASLAIFLACLVTSPLLFLLMFRAAPLLCAAENERVWQFLWLVPATFCIIFYYNLYSCDSILDFSRSSRNVIFSLIIGFGSFFVLHLVLRSVRENNLVLRLQAENHLLSLQTLQYEHLNSRIEEARRARHDLRQFQAVLASYLQTGSPEQLKKFAADFCAAAPPDKPLLYCRSLPLNALVSYYAELAADRRISFHVDIDYPENSPIPDMDLTVLLGNLLENALEACGRQSGGERFVSLIIRLQGGFAVIALDNSFGADGSTPGQTSCGTKLSSAHRPRGGIGIPSVRQIVEKNRGIVKFEHTDRVFSVSVMLPV